MGTAELRFYEELNDFLPAAERKQTIARSFIGTPTVKDTIESCGVPHTEIDLVVVDGEPVGFDHHLHGGERVAVYPVFESIDISSVVRLRGAPLRDPRFIVDANLGRLARLLRLLGFDSTYDSTLDDREVVSRAEAEQRIVLTRDRGLLMRRAVSRGYFVRSQAPRKQASEVVRRFDLRNQIRPLTRCTHCNGLLLAAEKEAISDRLPVRTRTAYTRFFECERCSRLYWRGAHSDHLVALIAEILEAADSAPATNSGY